jgi:hypothetical protein
LKKLDLNLFSFYNTTRSILYKLDKRIKLGILFTFFSLAYFSRLIINFSSNIFGVVGDGSNGLLWWGWLAGEGEALPWNPSSYKVPYPAENNIWNNAYYSQLIPRSLFYLISNLNLNVIASYNLFLIILFVITFLIIIGSFNRLINSYYFRLTLALVFMTMPTALQSYIYHPIYILSGIFLAISLYLLKSTIFEDRKKYYLNIALLLSLGMIYSDGYSGLFLMIIWLSYFIYKRTFRKSPFLSFHEYIVILVLLFATIPLVYLSRSQLVSNITSNYIEPAGNRLNLLQYIFNSIQLLSTKNISSYYSVFYPADNPDYLNLSFVVTLMLLAITIGARALKYISVKKIVNGEMRIMIYYIINFIVIQTFTFQFDFKDFKFDSNLIERFFPFWRSQERIMLFFIPLSFLVFTYFLQQILQKNRKFVSLIPMLLTLDLIAVSYTGLPSQSILKNEEKKLINVLESKNKTSLYFFGFDQTINNRHNTLQALLDVSVINPQYVGNLTGPFQNNGGVRDQFTPCLMRGLSVDYVLAKINSDGLASTSNLQLAEKFKINRVLVEGAGYNYFNEINSTNKIPVGLLNVEPGPAATHYLQLIEGFNPTEGVNHKGTWSKNQTTKLKISNLNNKKDSLIYKFDVSFVAYSPRGDSLSVYQNNNKLFESEVYPSGSRIQFTATNETPIIIKSRQLILPGSEWIKGTTDDRLMGIFVTELNLNNCEN